MMINDDDIFRATQKDCAPQILATAQLAPPRPAASGHIGDDDEDGDDDDGEDDDDDEDEDGDGESTGDDGDGGDVDADC